MSAKYRYDHHKVKKHHYVGIAVGVCLLLVAAIVSLVLFDLKHQTPASVEGKSHVVGQVVGDNATKKTITEPDYSFQLPTDWKEFARTTNEVEHSVTWVTTKKDQSARILKIYLDTIPPNIPVNRMLPVTANSATLTSGDVSENCATFTQGGTLDTTKATKLSPALARWQGVDFLCNLPNVVDNQVGTSSHDGVNLVNITGPAKGTHKYFFLYTDRNIQPDYSILFEALSSFQAK